MCDRYGDAGVLSDAELQRAALESGEISADVADLLAGADHRPTGPASWGR